MGFANISQPNHIRMSKDLAVTQPLDFITFFLYKLLLQPNSQKYKNTYIGIFYFILLLPRLGIKYSYTYIKVRGALFGCLAVKFIKFEKAL